MRPGLEPAGLEQRDRIAAVPELDRDETGLPEHERDRERVADAVAVRRDGRGSARTQARARMTTSSSTSRAVLPLTLEPSRRCGSDRLRADRVPRTASARPSPDAHRWRARPRSARSRPGARRSPSRARSACSARSPRPRSRRHRARRRGAGARGRPPAVARPERARARPSPRRCRARGARRRPPSSTCTGPARTPRSPRTTRCDRRCRSSPQPSPVRPLHRDRPGERLREPGAEADEPSELAGEARVVELRQPGRQRDLAQLPEPRVQGVSRTGGRAGVPVPGNGPHVDAGAGALAAPTRPSRRTRDRRGRRPDAMRAAWASASSCLRRRGLGRVHADDGDPRPTRC